MSGHFSLQHLIPPLSQPALFHPKKLILAIIAAILLGHFFLAFGQEKSFENFEGSVRRSFMKETMVTHEIIHDQNRDGNVCLITVQTTAVDTFFGGVSFSRPTALPDRPGDTFNMRIKADPHQTLQLDIELHDDDNKDGEFDQKLKQDDLFKTTITLKADSGYQLISIPYSDFTDINPGNRGNGRFDPVAIASGGNGLLLEVVLAVTSENDTPSSTTFNIAVDDIHFKSGSQLLAVYDDFEQAVSSFHFGGTDDTRETQARVVDRSRIVDTPSIVGGDASERIRVKDSDGGYAGYFGYLRPTLLDTQEITGFSMWVKPDPNISFDLIIQLQDDDNGDGIFRRSVDDLFSDTTRLEAGSDWQCLQISLNNFFPVRSNGNGVFDPVDSDGDGKGRLLAVVFVFQNVPAPTSSDSTTFEIAVDNIGFTGNNTLAPFALLTPADGDTVDTRNPVLQWQQANGDDQAAGYHLIISTQPDFSDTVVAVGPLTDTIYTLQNSLQNSLQYYWKVIESNSACNTVESNTAFTFRVFAPAASVTNFELSPIYPNPFNREATIEFRLAREARVRLEVFNLMGQRVVTLFDAKRLVGNHDDIRWNGRNHKGQQAANGVYIVRMKAGSFSQTRRIVFLK